MKRLKKKLETPKYWLITKWHQLQVFLGLRINTSWLQYRFALKEYGKRIAEDILTGTIITWDGSPSTRIHVKLTTKDGVPSDYADEDENEYEFLISIMTKKSW